MLSYTPIERVISAMMLKSMLMVNNTSALLAVLAIHALVGRNALLVQSLVELADTTTTLFFSTITTSLLSSLLIVLVTLECARFY